MRLATSMASATRPTAILVHGLDSSRETWAPVLAECASRAIPALAVDLRGHGESPLGPPHEFSPSQLAADVLASARAAGVRDAVLVGHSMGGRVAIRAAALDAASDEPILKALVVEDMDVRVRAGPSPAAADLTDAQRAQLAAWADTERGRTFSSWEACRAELLPWYDKNVKRVNSWREKRVRPLPSGGWWSDVSPFVQRLARERVLASSDAAEAWAELGARGAASLPIHLWYADTPGTVVAMDGVGGINEMIATAPNCTSRKFPGAGHSIHSSMTRGFMHALAEVIDACAN